jgi:hypothetical protein
MSLTNDLAKSLNRVKEWQKGFRSNILCSLYNVVMFNNEQSELDIRFVYDEDRNEMNIVKIFINKDNDSKLYINYYYLKDGHKVTDLITEAVTDFPTSTMVEILFMWNKSVNK